MMDRDLCDSLDALRKAEGYSQQRLADKLGWGRFTLSRFFNYEENTIWSGLHLLGALGVDVKGIVNKRLDESIGLIPRPKKDANERRQPLKGAPNMSVPLIFNQPQVNTGLVTATCTIPSTVPGGFTFGGLCNAKIKIQVPQALPVGTSSGSGAGLGAGAGGGGEGFTGGDLGTGHGGVGQGFGTGNGYQQPPAYVSTNAQGASVASGLTLTVVNTTQSVTYLTTTAPKPTQSAAQYQISFAPTAGDVITITLSSSTASDAVKNGLQSIISVNQGAN